MSNLTLTTCVYMFFLHFCAVWRWIDQGLAVSASWGFPSAFLLVIYYFIPLLCWQQILLRSISVCEPSRRPVTFSPFSELGAGSGETGHLCLGGSELLGWLTFMHLKCTCRRTLTIHNKIKCRCSLPSLAMNSCSCAGNGWYYRHEKPQN